MRSLGAVHLVMLVVLVVLALDSRRLHTLARSAGRTRRDSQNGIPAGNPDRVGITLRQIQMRIHVDWQDGGIGWEGPEVLPADELDEALTDGADDTTVVTATTPEAPPTRALPILWKGFPALAAGDQLREAAA